MVEAGGANDLAPVTESSSFNVNPTAHSSLQRLTSMVCLLDPPSYFAVTPATLQEARTSTLRIEKRSIVPWLIHHMALSIQ